MASPAHTNVGQPYAAEPVTYTAEENRRLPRRVAQIIKSKIDVETGALFEEVDVTLEAIRRRQGYIAGLKWALQECESMDKELNGT